MIRDLSVGVDALARAADSGLSMGKREEPSFVATIAGARRRRPAVAVHRRVADRGATDHGSGGVERGPAAARKRRKPHRRMMSRVLLVAIVAGFALYAAGTGGQLIGMLREGASARVVPAEGGIAAARGRVRSRAAGPAREGDRRDAAGRRRPDRRAGRRRRQGPARPRHRRGRGHRPAGTRTTDGRPGPLRPARTRPDRPRRHAPHRPRPVETSRTCRWTAAAGSSSSTMVRSSRPTRAAATCVAASTRSRTVRTILAAADHRLDPPGNR